MSLLKVRYLEKRFPIRGPLFKKPLEVLAVQNVSFEIARGETLGLVGESGCGKSTLGRCVLQLLRPTAGSVVFDGIELTTLSRSKLKALRKRMQIIFQDPYASLNPRMTIGGILEEALIIHKLAETSRQRQKRVEELLETVGLPKDCIHRYPHEFSGGQRQRVGIARALAVEPELIICDEPVSALDVSVQAQILNLLMDLQERFKLSYLFIAHDLKVVEHISHRVAVMYLGKLVELGTVSKLYGGTKHPYTKALLSAVPIADPKASRQRIWLRGEPPKPSSPPSGCQFHPRCFMAVPECATKSQTLTSYRGAKDHFVACTVEQPIVEV